MIKILICQVIVRDEMIFLGQQESGEIIPGAIPFADQNDDYCLMRVHPAIGFGTLDIPEILRRWGSGNNLINLIECKVWAAEDIEKLIPKDEGVRFFIEIQKTNQEEQAMTLKAAYKCQNRDLSYTAYLNLCQQWRSIPLSKNDFDLGIYLLQKDGY